MAFKIEKDSSKWLVLATGEGWQLAPKKSNGIICCLNDYIKVETYQIRPDYLFLMDVLDEKPSIVSGTDNLGSVIARINQMKCPLIAPFKYEEIPLSEAFPLKEVATKFGLVYFTNTICYMIAFAILKGAKEIELYGVNQAGSHEYTEERTGVDAWLGFAIGLGIKVTVHGKNSQVLKHKGRYAPEGILYGYGIDYEGYLRDEQRFGEAVIKKLLVPPQNVSRTFRKFGV